MKLKICGMKYDSNIKEVLNLKPNYIGFIFWKNSQRYVTNTPSIPNQIIKTGVFVDSPIDKIISIVENHNLKAIQLHGNENPEICLNLKKNLNVEIIKAFKNPNCLTKNPPTNTPTIVIITPKILLALAISIFVKPIFT